VNKNKSARKPDFSGVATKANVKCKDGRTIMPKAFAHNDGKRVPLVWQHGHEDVTNVLGHGILKYQTNGDVRLDGYFNNSTSGQHAKEAVEAENIDSMSIWANELQENNLKVMHGDIKEVSLVLAGKNPGAKIDYISFEHGDEASDEAILYSGESLEHGEESDPETQEDNESTIEHSSEDPTVEEIYNSFTDVEKSAVHALMDAAIEAATSNDGEMAQSDTDEENKGDKDMKRNAFSKEENNDKDMVVLSHADLSTVLEDAAKKGVGSLKEAFIAHTQTYGIENVDFLFPDARNVRTMPDEITRDQGWVGHFMGKSTHTPFSRIRSTSVDLTIDAARALGYVKGTLKKEDFIAIARRVTLPTTVYIKKSIDRDDIIDITDFDVVLWQKGHMRVGLNEEMARAGLIGDGRDAEHADKINETNIRPVYKDDVFYAPRVVLASDKTIIEMMDSIVEAQKDYKGTRSPVLYTTTVFFLKMLLVRDDNKRRMYNSKADVAAALNVADIVEVPVMDGVTRSITTPAPATINLLGIIMNPVDYTYGADRGGAVNTFDDFDIDYNRQKFLMEGRSSGALTRPMSALIIEQMAAG
jgi:hypothetical protein